MSKAQLYMKIVNVMNTIGQLQKDGEVTDRNGKKMYNYLSEEQTTGELQRACIEHKLVIFPVKVEPELMMVKITKFDKEVEAAVTKVVVTYKIVDAETGEHDFIMSIGYGSDDQDKGSNKAMTGAYKYMQRQTFMISTGDDGDHVSTDKLNSQYERPKAVQGPPTTPAKQTPPPSTPATTKPAYTVQHSFKRDAYSLREELFMTWNDLQSFSERVLDRKIGKVTAIQDEKDWEMIVRELKTYQSQPSAALAGV